VEYRIASPLRGKCVPRRDRGVGNAVILEVESVAIRARTASVAGSTGVAVVASAAVAAVVMV